MEVDGSDDFPYFLGGPSFRFRPVVFGANMIFLFPPQKLGEIGGDPWMLLMDKVWKLLFSFRFFFVGHDIGWNIFTIFGAMNMFHGYLCQLSDHVDAARSTTSFSVVKRNAKEMHLVSLMLQHFGSHLWAPTAEKKHADPCKIGDTHSVAARCLDDKLSAFNFLKSKAFGLKLVRGSPDDFLYALIQSHAGDNEQFSSAFHGGTLQKTCLVVARVHVQNVWTPQLVHIMHYGWLKWMSY